MAAGVAFARISLPMLTAARCVADLMGEAAAFSDSEEHVSSLPF